MRKILHIVILMLILTAGLMLSGCGSDGDESGTDMACIGTYDMYSEDDEALGTTVEFREDGTVTDSMHGEYVIANRTYGMAQLTMRMSANDDSVVYDVRKTEDGCSLIPAGDEDLGEDSGSRSIDLEFISGEDSICKGKAFSGSYVMKDYGNVRYTFESDKTMAIETDSTWSSDGKTLTWDKAEYDLQTLTENGTVTSITLKSKDGTGTIKLQRK